MSTSDGTDAGSELRRLRGALVALSAAEGCFCAAHGDGLRLRVGGHEGPARPAIDDVLALLDDPTAPARAVPDGSVTEVRRWAVALTKQGIAVPPVVRRAAEVSADDERLLREVPPHH